MRSAHDNPDTALRYVLRRAGGEPISITLPAAAVGRVCMPDPESKARLVAAVLNARCRSDEELELFGENVTGLDAARREHLRFRIGVLTPAVGLISNLNVWENISLPAAYHGAPPIAQVAETACGALEALGTDPERLLPRLPEQLGAFEKKLVEFVRLLAAQPALALFDALGEGLTGEECARAARFEAEYRARQPTGTLIHVFLPGGQT
jgi:phospholipid/cholesterol/gamma-HCH transport system ATP-binding protein